ncbi:hypothetical protein FISHEDRAFT_60251 [Fistulina hepatica ATCC 64428]|uniref:Uncharacterized protein n=1 Tax=Fistulina hepatica ATCC 64428 TaxID=1128425 RepID=A0A0D7A6C1_9AGAR|nr:hypothetical protein FISHEDRAFT_60251 [Fistulina hepatica ATCC 64428]
MSPTSSQPRSESSYLHFDDTPRQTEFFPSSSTLLHIAGSTTLPVVTDTKVAHSPTVVDLVTFPADRSVPGHSKLLTVPVQSQSSRGPAYVHRAHSRASSDPTSLSSVLKSHEPLYGIPYGYHAYAYDYRSRSPYGRLGATQPYSIWSMDALPMSQMQQHRDSWSAYSGRAFSDPSLHSTGARSPLVVPLSLRNVGIVSHGVAGGSSARTEKGFRERKIRLIKARTQAVRGRSQQRRKLTLPHWSLGARLELEFHSADACTDCQERNGNITGSANVLLFCGDRHMSFLSLVDVHCYSQDEDGATRSQLRAETDVMLTVLQDPGMDNWTACSAGRTLCAAKGKHGTKGSTSVALGNEPLAIGGDRAASICSPGA